MDKFIKSATVIVRDNKFLLVQEKGQKAYGLWNWVQGKVEEGESVEEAAVREAKEETGFDIKLKVKLGVIENSFEDTKEIHVFLSEIVRGELCVNEHEIIQGRWFSPDELEGVRDQVVGPWVMAIIKSIRESTS